MIELRLHAADDMDIPTTSMMNTRRIQVALDVYLANRGCGSPTHLGDCARITGNPELIGEDSSFRIADHPFTILFGFWHVKLNLGRYPFPEFAVTWRGESLIRIVRA